MNEKLSNEFTSKNLLDLIKELKERYEPNVVHIPKKIEDETAIKAIWKGDGSVIHDQYL